MRVGCSRAQSLLRGCVALRPVANPRPSARAVPRQCRDGGAGNAACGGTWQWVDDKFSEGLVVALLCEQAGHRAPAADFASGSSGDSSSEPVTQLMTGHVRRPLYNAGPFGPAVRGVGDDAAGCGGDKDGWQTVAEILRQIGRRCVVHSLSATPASFLAASAAHPVYTTHDFVGRNSLPPHSPPSRRISLSILW